MQVVRLQWLLTIWKTRENCLRTCNTEVTSTCVSKTTWCNSHPLFFCLRYILVVNLSGYLFPTWTVTYVKLNLPPLPLRCWRDFEDNLSLWGCFSSWPHRLDAEWIMFLTSDCSMMSKIERSSGICLYIWTWQVRVWKDAGVKIYSDEPNRLEHIG